ncbi:hydroxymethylbilane synthase [Granulicella sp. 5B5]|uniref:hydroxymethylbilane synthase n=1 Tax=Granulicella sp. 5B5 TaxID=1617967 RepID=UPI0015F4F467|nr:hydroxymethylbilane synthase [Granulicella sp. 5B5]QMV19923.1 hydroxymethylbilane synthase [Granulicella sp. 5B5]
MSTSTIRIGSRGSQLALWQANHIADQLRANGHTVEIEVIRTVGDRMQDPQFVAPSTFPDGTPLDSKGIFIKEIEDALLDGRVDLAVHSLKDLPTTLDPRFTLAAIPPRADARDAFVCEDHWGLHMLPSGARVATTSPRRQAMILALRPDIQFVQMRGNIDTRLRKWEEGQCDALILASAGLDRLGRTQHVHQRFSIDELTPAPGQGALALETRCPHALKGTGFSPSVASGQREGALAPEALNEAIRALNCCATEYAVTAERAVLDALGGGCQLPLGAYCHASDDQWHLHAMVVSPDGEQIAHIIQRAPIGIAATDLGHSVAEALKARGALDLLQQTA